MLNTTCWGCLHGGCVVDLKQDQQLLRLLLVQSAAEGSVPDMLGRHVCLLPALTPLLLPSSWALLLLLWLTWLLLLLLL